MWPPASLSASLRENAEWSWGGGEAAAAEVGVVNFGCAQNSCVVGRGSSLRSVPIISSCGVIYMRNDTCSQSFQICYTWKSSFKRILNNVKSGG